MLDPAAETWAQAAATFAAGLLDSDHPVPPFLTSMAGRSDPVRYAVYRNNVTVGLARALEANFPSLVTLLGPEFFTAMARAYISGNPPRSRLMFEYGDGFPDFLAEFEPARPYPYLPDVARIEQAWRQAFHAADAPVLSGGSLGAVPPDALAQVRLVPHPATRMIRSRFAAGSIFAASRSGSDLAGIDGLREEFALVTRPQLDCHVRILAAADGAFIASLLEGQPLEAAYAHAIAVTPAFDLPRALTGLLASGAFTSIKE